MKVYEIKRFLLFSILFRCCNSVINIIVEIWNKCSLNTYISPFWTRYNSKNVLAVLLLRHFSISYINSNFKLKNTENYNLFCSHELIQFSFLRYRKILLRIISLFQLPWSFNKKKKTNNIITYAKIIIIRFASLTETPDFLVKQ